ncbi:MAG: DMT family transporter [Alphaproteobacteria bacterium]|nr:DMT family transporter [Alphaproteobacteria bacterium]
MAAALGSAVGGTAAVAARILAPEAGAATVGLLRYLGLLVLLLAGAAVFRLRMPRIARADWPAIFAMGLLQFGLFGWFFSAGFTYVSAARGTIVMATMPIQTLLISALVGRERFTLLKLVGTLVGVAGVLVALWGDEVAAGPSAWKGDLCLFAAGFVTALNSVLVGPYLRRYSVYSVSLLATTVGCVLLGIVFIATGAQVEVVNLSRQGWLAILYFAAVPTLLGFITWSWALARVAPTRVTVTVVLNPIAAALAAAWMLGEPLGVRVIVGVALVTTAIVIVNWGAGSRRAEAADPRAT